MNQYCFEARLWVHIIVLAMTQSEGTATVLVAVFQVAVFQDTALPSVTNQWLDCLKV